MKCAVINDVKQFDSILQDILWQIFDIIQSDVKGSLTVWALYAYFSDSQNAAFELLVWCI